MKLKLHEPSTQGPPPTDGQRRSPVVLGARSSVGHDLQEVGLDTSPSQQHVQTALSEARQRTPLPSGPRPRGRVVDATDHTRHADGRRHHTQLGHDGRRLSVNERQGPHEVISISALQMQNRAQAPGHKECLSQGSHPTVRISPPTAAAVVRNHFCCAPCAAIFNERKELVIHQEQVHGMIHDKQPLAESLKETTVAGKDYRASNPAPSTTALPRRLPKMADADPTLEQQRDAPLCAFNCVFDFAGCEATFVKKNEWKRHVATKHLLLNYWRCAEGACAAAESSSQTPTHTAPPNGSIFNRKDLFTQHLKRMHAPKEIKDLLNDTSTNTTNSSKKPSSHKPKPTPVAKALLAEWDLHVCTLQSIAIHSRCTLPNRMRCPVPECAEPEFCGADAWDQRMEHVAQHMVPPSKGGSSARTSEKVVFGGESDTTLVDWASQPDVAIIEPGEEGGWVLKTPLKRLSSGSVVVTAPVQQVVHGEIAVLGELSPLTKQECAYQPVEKKVPVAGTLANGQSNEIPAVERDTPYAAAPQNDDTDTRGVEVSGGPDLPEDIRALTADMETQDNEVSPQPRRVVLDDPDFPQCGNCEWDKRRCHSASSLRPSSSRSGIPAKPPTKIHSSGGSFTAANSIFGSHQGKAADAEAADMGDDEWEVDVGGSKKGPQKLLLESRSPPVQKSNMFEVASQLGRLLDKNAETGNISKEVIVPRSLKRKVPQLRKTTISEANAAAGRNKSSSSTAGSLSAADKTVAAIEPKSKKIKIKFVNSQSRNASKPSIAKPKIILSIVAAEMGNGLDENVTSSSGFECDGYTSTDSISGDRLQPSEWRLHQVKTRTFATNPSVTQYWHWVTEEKDCDMIEHQVLESVRPIKWSVFKKPYNFHLKPADIQEVAFARDSKRVMVTHKKGRDGKDKGPRGDMMAQFKRDRTKRRFLSFLGREKGVKISEVGK